MEPFPVVEQLDVPENGLPHVFDVLTPVGHRKSLRDLYSCASIMPFCKQACNGHDIRLVDFYRKSCASVMPEHKQACVGRNSRLVDFCHCFTFWGLRNDREPSAA